MYDSKQKEVFKRVAATFPATFGLRAFPGDTFRISESSSYFNGPMLSCEEQHLMLYVERHKKSHTERKRGDEWVDFAKGTAEELRRQVVADPFTNDRSESHDGR